MNILVSGASGLIGSALVPYLEGHGHHLLKVTRKGPKEQDIFWSPPNGVINIPSNPSIDAVIHLAGENIAESRWTKRKKERIRSSRIDGTQLISRTIASLNPRPVVMLSASGIGIYGDRGDGVITESEPPGKGFLIDVCREWEVSTASAEAAVRNPGT